MSERFETMRRINSATVYKYSPFLYYLLSSVLTYFLKNWLLSFPGWRS